MEDMEEILLSKCGQKMSSSTLDIPRSKKPRLSLRSFKTPEFEVNDCAILQLEDDVFDKENNAALSVSPLSPSPMWDAAFIVDSPTRKALQKDASQLPSGIRKLGQGAFGTVVLGSWNAKRVAIKIVDKVKTNLRRETNALKLDHANVVKIHQIFMAGDLDKNSLVVMEYVGHYNLANIIHSQPNKLNENFVLRSLTHLAQGLLHCHSKGILHLDVKPANVLVTKDPEDANKPIFKLADFGCSRQISDEEIRATGTPGYQAPEVLGQKATVKSDVYSFGVVAWQMFCKQHTVYPGMHPHTIMFKVATDSQFNPEAVTPSPECKNKSLKHLYRRCWCFQASKRPMMSEIASILNTHRTELSIARATKRRRSLRL